MTAVDLEPRETEPTPKRRGGSARGTKPIRRTIPGYGILKVASGVTTPKEFSDVDKAVQAIGRAGRFDWLRAIDPKYQGQRKPVELVNLLRQYAPARLPDPLTKPFTAEAVLEWIGRWGVGQEHRDSTRQHLLALCKLTNSVDDLPRVLRAEQKRLAAEGKPYQFKTRRKAAVAYLKNELGPRHDAFKGVMDIPAPTKRDLSKKARPHNHHSLAQCFNLIARLGPGYDQEWMNMFLTSARPTENFRDDRGYALDFKTGHILIKGGKTGTSERTVPKLKVTGPDGRVWTPNLTGPAMPYERFRERLHHITNAAVVPRDARRSYSLWTREARLDYLYWKVYMGHAVDQTEFYAKQGAVRMIDANARQLMEWLEGQEKQDDAVHLTEPLYDKAVSQG